MKEYELYEPLRLGLEKLGLEVFGEVSLNYGSSIDCIALKDRKYIIGIELKRTNSKSAIKQAIRTKKYCHCSIIATPKMPSDKFKKKLLDNGIGFILLNYQILNEQIESAKIDYIVAPKLGKPIKNLILHPYFRKQTGGVSINHGPVRRTIFQQLSLDVEAYLKARKGKAVHFNEIYKWVEGYCFGTVPRSKIVKIIKVSPNLIMHKRHVTYFKNHLSLIPEEKQLVIQKAIKRNIDDRRINSSKR